MKFLAQFSYRMKNNVLDDAKKLYRNTRNNPGNFFFFFLPFTMLFDTMLCHLTPIWGQSNSDVVDDHKGKGDCEERRQ